MPDLSQRLTSALADRYRIERTLGRGGMATVFLAEDLKHHRRVAIKVLDPEVAAAIGPERFLREIETAASLQHPHILPLFDSGAADGLLYYVMPYVAGESLRDRLTREKQLPLEDALRIAREVADALSYAHSHGVVHRDVKPENILLQAGHAVVADFGIARAVAAAGGEKLTATGIAVGTPGYMSPEQATGGRDLDGRSDLYSLGCVLYEMLAGVPPFAGTTAESLAHQHLNLAPRPITELRPAVPAAVAAALQRALAKAPADRFNPVALFGEALGASGGATVAATGHPRSGWLLAVVGLVVVMAAAVMLWGVRGPRERPPAATAPTHARTDIAVLPLQNLSAGGPHAYFAGGLHEELLTQLAKVASLKVISRTSVMGYEGTKTPLKQIAAELGVGSIIEGSVQVVGNRLRVNVQLIDAATDEHLWAERYDRTLDDAFAIQSDVAQQVVGAVGAALAAGERRAIAEPPTANAEAYRLYLHGREYLRRAGDLRSDMERAQGFFERALQLDPSFVLAHAALSNVHGLMYWYRYDPSPARAARMREEAETAVRLAPNLPEAQVAMGYVYYRLDLDYGRALEVFQAAQRRLPNDADVWEAVGVTQRRLGHWREAIAALEKSAQLDPRSESAIGVRLGGTRGLMRQYAQAVRDYDTALALDPNLSNIAIDRGHLFVAWRGQLDTLRTVLKRLAAGADAGQDLVADARLGLLLRERNGEGMLRELGAVHTDAFSGAIEFTPAALYEALAQDLRGDRGAARAASARALTCADSALARAPDDWRIHAARGYALAGLGRRAEALREADWLVRSRVYREDAFFGMIAARFRGLILARAGETEAALDEVDRILGHPSYDSVHTIRLDPRWDPIRDHPRFKALLVKYANPESPAR